ncbi:primosomal protein N' [Paenibacillus flagellatus]|uniref:Replication restart protein PriA n=1 Tax=Paenibacillus flagellatus TaxID=2211139 RepID=A0A2V5K4X6_9BACL|nr:primosomal protein N' [Paenibacillus flagellatus]PYI54351.1 primosomal protein N' [Paenibacillus flagellatus]
MAGRESALYDETLLPLDGPEPGRRYAQVIVDVPAKQTNRPFDYIVPPELEAWVGVGSRVGVPFGPRTLQGFVVGLSESTGMDPRKLKPIEQVLDLVPPLNPELVDLARWMSRTYVCHEITALQAMIPGALKAKYEKYVAVAEEADGHSAPPPEGQALLLAGSPEEDEITAFVRQKGTVPMDAMLRRFPAAGPLLKRMLERGVLVEVQTVKDRLNAKKVLYVEPAADPRTLTEESGKLAAGAKRQKELLLHFAAHPSPVPLAELTDKLNVGAGTVKALADKGWLTIREREVFRDPYAGRSFARTEPLPLTEQQRGAFAAISDALGAERHDVFLLHGVTGSGKTEVYLQSIQQCLDQGREAIVLVPEISLTPQMVERFKSRFGDAVAVMHSRLSQGERYDEWRKIGLKRVSVVIGARSAVFAPFTKLGLIIIDEEHESSYKQEESPKYHAREVAVQRAARHGAVVVLGSATPSLESFARTSGRGAPYRLLTMADRVEGRPLPAVRIVDLREELKAGNRSMFSRGLYKAIEERLHKKEQTVLLLNRRGYSTFVMCRSCGYVVQCPHCDISLTYHQVSRTMRCHYCGLTQPEPKTCPSCDSEHIRFFGTGTQRVEEELGKLFPGIRVIRMDVDTTSEKGAHERLLTKFRNKQGDVLLGTQMVAKGLDFPDVTLVGVIAADTVLHLPDFRAAEKTFQLLTQVAGRAGRHRLPGEVFIQTYTPDHYSIEHASRHDYGAFIATELDSRRQRGYPPYCELVLVTFSHEQVAMVVRAAESFATRLKEKWQRMRTEFDSVSGAGAEDRYFEVYGPVASPIPRIKDRYRFQCMVKYRGDVDVSGMLTETAAAFDETVRQEKLHISIDVNPQVLM